MNVVLEKREINFLILKYINPSLKLGIRSASFTYKLFSTSSIIQWDDMNLSVDLPTLGYQWKYNGELHKCGC